MSLDALPPLRDSLQAHGLLAKKSFGQHFLLDLNVTRKIARLAGADEDSAVIEVGPGPGGLTRALLETGSRVVAVEKDARFIPLLQDLSAAADGSLTVVEADALEVSEADLLAAAAPGRPARIVANLPYNVSVPLLVKWLRQGGMWRSLTLMFQKEVADRITARPSTADYGRLSVIAQAAAQTETVMVLPARAFTPPPKVDSAVVRLTPLQQGPPRERLALLERVTQSAFGQRRKMLRSSLKPLGGEALCAAAAVGPDLRAEAVDVAGFLRLAEALGAADPQKK